MYDVDIQEGRAVPLNRVPERTMPRTVHHQLADDQELPPLESLPKQEFGRRLYHLILQKGWSQSELARRADLPRDSISVYVRGKSLPTPLSLNKLARALEMTPQELLPNYTVEAVRRDGDSSFEMKVSGSDPTKSWVKVNRLVSTATAAKIAQLLAEEGRVEE